MPGRPAYNPHCYAPSDAPPRGVAWQAPASARARTELVVGCWVFLRSHRLRGQIPLAVETPPWGRAARTPSPELVAGGPVDLKRSSASTVTASTTASGAKVPSKSVASAWRYNQTSFKMSFDETIERL